jgi:hypothetical protein
LRVTGENFKTRFVHGKAYAGFIVEGIIAPANGAFSRFGGEGVLVKPVFSVLAEYEKTHHVYSGQFGHINPLPRARGSIFIRC